MMLRGHYELKQIIGSGAHGNVYHGLDLSSQNPVAIKHLRPDVVRSDPDILARFQREAEALRQLNHPNIVHVLDTFAEGNDHYIVMDFLAGGSLRDVLDKTPCLPVERVLHIALDLSDALIRAHRLGIVHRDLKPANVLLSEDGMPRLSDFGVAFLPEKERLTDSRGMIGTLAYMAPEVINSEDPNVASDIWSFGVMVYEMLAGARPFENATATGLIVAILTQPPGDLEAARPDIPTALIDLIYRMLDKSVQTRVSSMRRAGAELEAILQHVASGATPPTLVSWVDVSASTDKIDITPAVKHNLPAQITAFVGREREMEELLRLVRTGPQPRLITLLGPGGMGKSRLSLEVGQRLLSEEGSTPYPDGVYFVAMAPLPTVDRLPQAIAEAVGYLMQKDVGDPLDQIAAFLADRRMFLILDNFEHLIEGASMVVRLLEAAPSLMLLITSRERLNLSAEHLFTLKGLSTPMGNASASPLEYDAVQLFVQSAQRVQPGFTLKEADIGSVAEICRLVQGLPLGVMLAATWAEMLSPTEIATELKKSADFLEANMKDLAERHRSMRAVFEYSWQRLSEAEQQTLARLSVFSGPCSRSAAQAVTGASLRDLMQLVNKSLLYRDNETGFYTLHELVRQFAEVHLKEISGDYGRTLETHSRYYCAWLKDLLPIMQGTQVEALTAMDAELDNIRQAWQQAIARKDIDALGMAVETLDFYQHMRTLFIEFIPTFAEAIQALETLPASPARDQALGRLYSYQSHIFPHLQNKDVAFQNAAHAVEILRGTDDEVGLCYALYMLSGLTSFMLGDKTKAEILSQEALALARKHFLIFHEANIQLQLAYYALFQGHRQQSLVWCEKALAIFDQLQNPAGRAGSLIMIGQQYFWYDNFEQTIAMLQAAVRNYESIGAWSDVVEGWIFHTAVYTHAGDYPSARRAVHQALRVADEYGLRSDKVWAYRDLGTLDLLEGQYEEALEHYREAEIYAGLTGVHIMAPIYVRIYSAHVLIEMGRVDESDQILREVETVEKKLWHDVKFYAILLKQVRGHWYKAMQRLEEAEVAYLNALHMFLHADDLYLDRPLFVDLAEVWQQQGRRDQAAKAASLVHRAVYVPWHYRNKAAAVLTAVRPHFSDEEWAQIEADATATSLQAYAESLVKDLPEA